MVHEAFGKYSLGWTVVFEWQGQSSISWRWWMFRATKDQQNDRKCWKNSRTRPRILSPNNPWARRHCWDQLWNLPGDLKRKFECALHCSIMTMRPPTCPRKPQSFYLTATCLSFPSSLLARLCLQNWKWNWSDSILKQCVTSKGNCKQYLTALRKMHLKCGKNYEIAVYIPKETILKEMAAKIL
jgi:hypothetical protein